MGELGASGFTAARTSRRAWFVSRTSLLSSDASLFASSAASAADNCSARSWSAPLSSSRRLRRKRATAPSSARGSRA